MPQVIELKHAKCGDTECSINTFGATVVSWKVDGIENIFVSSLAKTDGTKGRHSSCRLPFYGKLIKILFSFESEDSEGKDYRDQIVCETVIPKLYTEIG